MRVRSRSFNREKAASGTTRCCSNPRLDFYLVQHVSLLSSGMFGEVWLATYKKQKIAANLLKEKNAYREPISESINEIKLLLTFSHPKIVGFLGVVWNKGSDVAVLTEFMVRGDLRSRSWCSLAR